MRALSALDQVVLKVSIRGLGLAAGGKRRKELGPPPPPREGPLGRKSLTYTLLLPPCPVQVPLVNVMDV